MGSAPTWVVWSAVTIVAVLSLVLAWLLIRRWMKPSSSSSSSEAFSQANKDKVIFMYMTGCGWCTKFEPTWQDFSSESAPKLGIQTLKFERSEDGAKEYMKHVEGFPTILFVNGTTGEVTVFDGERTVEGLTAFVKKESSNVPPQPTTETMENAGANADAKEDKETKEMYDEPTEFGNIFNGVSASKSAANDNVAHMDKKIRDNAGGSVEATSKARA